MTGAASAKVGQDTLKKHTSFKEHTTQTLPLTDQGRLEQKSCVLENGLSVRATDIVSTQDAESGT